MGGTGVCRDSHVQGPDCGTARSGSHAARVTSFVGLAEGTIANAAFDPGKPFFDGTLFHCLVSAIMPRWERLALRFKGEVSQACVRVRFIQ
jgi:hypothetical protein